jgi:hypothetical protein
MESENRPTAPEMSFTETQSELLGKLRSRYQQDGGLFTARELSHLRFMRWLLENTPVGQDSSSGDSSHMPLQSSGMPVGPDLGGTPWCVL